MTSSPLTTNSCTLIISQALKPILAGFLRNLCYIIFVLFGLSVIYDCISLMSWEKLRSEGGLTQEGIKGIVILTFDHLFV